jgi:hypothetical protein
VGGRSSRVPRPSECSGTCLPPPQPSPTNGEGDREDPGLISYIQFNGIGPSGGRFTLTNPLASYCPDASHRIPSRAQQTRKLHLNVAGRDERAVLLTHPGRQVAPSDGQHYCPYGCGFSITISPRSRVSPGLTVKSLRICLRSFWSLRAEKSVIRYSAPGIREIRLMRPSASVPAEFQ